MASLSSRIAPRTDCSASRFCGGTRFRMSSVRTAAATILTPKADALNQMAPAGKAGCSVIRHYPAPLHGHSTRFQPLIHTTYPQAGDIRSWPRSLPSAAMQHEVHARLQVLFRGKTPRGRTGASDLLGAAAHA